jgi:hypothetical protein
MALELIYKVAPLVLSIVSIVVALLALRHNIASKRFQLDTQYATFKLARNQMIQEKLESWDVLELYGIDLEQASQEGVSKDHIVSYAFVWIRSRLERALWVSLCLST